MATALAFANTSPALAFTALGQDAELIALEQPLEASFAEYMEASETTMRLSRLANGQFPPLPDILKGRQVDVLNGLPLPNQKRWEHPEVASSKAGYYTTCHLGVLREYVTRDRGPSAMARANELIAAIEIWRKDCRKIRHEIGLLKAERERNRSSKKHFDLIDKVAATNAKTLRGIIIKARAVKMLYSDEEKIELGEGNTDEFLAASILNELLALKAA
jgi:hypothetical protein